MIFHKVVRQCQACCECLCRTPQVQYDTTGCEVLDISNHCGDRVFVLDSMRFWLSNMTLLGYELQRIIYYVYIYIHHILFILNLNSTKHLSLPLEKT